MDRAAYAELPPDPFHAFRVIEDPWRKPPFVDPILRDVREILRTMIRVAESDVQRTPSILPVAAEPGSGKSHLLRWVLHETARRFRRTLLVKPSPDAPLAEQLLQSILGDLRHPEQRASFQGACNLRLSQSLAEAAEDPACDRRRLAILEGLVQRSDPATLQEAISDGTDFHSVLTAGRWKWSKTQWALLLAAWDPQESRWPAVGALLGHGADVPGWPGPLGSGADRLHEILSFVGPFYVGIDDLDSWLDHRKREGASELVRILDGLYSRAGSGIVVLAVHDDAWARELRPALEPFPKLKQRIGYSTVHGWEPFLPLRAAPVRPAVLEQIVRAYVEACAGAPAEALRSAWQVEPGFPIPACELEALARSPRWNLRELVERLSALYRRHAPPPRAWDLAGPQVWAEPPPSRLRHVRPDEQGRLMAEVALADGIDEISLRVDQKRADVRREGARKLPVRDGSSVHEDGRSEDYLTVCAHRSAPLLRLVAGERPLGLGRPEFIAESRVRLEVTGHPVPVASVNVSIDGERFRWHAGSEGFELAEGRHEIACEAIDATGSSARATWRITVDRSAPSVVLFLDGQDVDGAAVLRLREGQRLEACTRTAHWSGDVEWVLDGGEVQRGRSIEVRGPSHDLELRPATSPAGLSGVPRRLRVEVRPAVQIRFEASADPAPLQLLPASLARRIFVQPGSRLIVRARGEEDRPLEVSVRRGVWADAREGFRLPAGDHRVDVRALEDGHPLASATIDFSVIQGLRLLRPVYEAEDPIDRSRALAAWLSAQPGTRKCSNEAKHIAQCWGKGPEPSPDVLRLLANRLAQLERNGGAPPEGCASWPEDSTRIARALGDDLEPVLKKRFGNRLGESLTALSLSGLGRLVEVRASERDLVAIGLSGRLDGSELSLGRSDRAGEPVRVRWEESGPPTHPEATLVLRLVGVKPGPAARIVAILTYHDVAFLCALADLDATVHIVGGTKEARPLAERLAGVPERDIAEFLARRPIWEALGRLTARRFDGTHHVVA